VGKPIGVFDSGLGGLTVARAIRRALPQEHLVYLGDTARVPYGTRSARTVVRYAIGCAERLLAHDMKLLVVACNTVSGVALEALRERLSIPVIGVIEPGARAGIAASRNARIGVLATAGTVASRAYERAIQAEDPGIRVFTQAAPLLVPLAEEGWISGEVPRLAARRYLQPLVDSGVDTIVLGCTHYPLLAGVIAEEAQELIHRDVAVVDSADATAAELRALLGESESRPGGPGGELRVLVTDRPDAFASVASRFLGETVANLDVEAIDL
jgi:glutamate racemase